MANLKPRGEVVLEVSCTGCDRTLADVFDPKRIPRAMVETALTAAFKRHARDFHCAGKMKITEASRG